MQRKIEQKGLNVTAKKQMRKGMGGPKFTVMQRENILTFIQECFGKGLSYRTIQVAIKDKFEVSVSLGQMAYYKRRLYKRLAKQQTSNYDELRAEKKHQFAIIRAYAWEALAKSEKDIENIVNEMGPLPIPKDKNGKPLQLKGSRDETLRLLKQVHEKKGRLPASEWMDKILKTMELEMKLDGMMSDIHIGDKVEGDKLEFNWNETIGSMPLTDPAQEAIEAKVVSVKKGDE